jgi:hypothetical protein
MIDFTTVSREFRSLVERRRELLTFLGSAFAALGLFLRNVLAGGLPPSLSQVEQHGFAFYAFVLMVLSLVLALRMAKLHGGMVLNGVLYARLMQDQDYTPHKGDPKRAAKHNFLGASFLQFILVDLIASFSAAILGLALTIPLFLSIGLGVLVGVVWLILNFRFHHQAASFALKKASTESCKPFSRNELEEHVADSMQQANQGMLSEIAFAGLMVFSVFESLSGLGKMEARQTDFSKDAIVSYGPWIYTILMVVTCLLELMIYLRLRLAAGSFWMQLDPTDQPFRPFKLTDSFLGYVVLAFLFTVSLHILLILAIPGLEQHTTILLAIDGIAFLLALAAEQMTILVAGKKDKR